MNGSDQRQTTTPSGQGSRGEGHVERPGGDLEAGSSSAGGNGSEMSFYGHLQPVQKKTLLERIRALFCGGTGIEEAVDF
ncbi:hypothetical protein V5O48_013374 [Marasmius crinis-equi]|uniref:Uncharacterized protein n=1 Tax=Marasmius crinis-equi TaxID=585013 RepID=A0ABR3F0D3_9AGAR